MSNQFHLRPQGVHAPNGYAHAVSATGRTVFVSGQVALDEQGTLVGQNDAQAQIEQVFRNLAAVLRDAGATLTDIVKITVFLTDIADMGAFRTVRDRHLDSERPPASTLVQVAALARPELRVEIEAIAVVAA